MAGDPASGRATVWFLGVAALYFMAQAALRTWLGGTLEVDEAEMLLLADGWRWGYGPQLPLYNWAQVLAFGLFGKTAAGLAFLKGAMLWLAAAGMWFAMRAAFGPGRAAMAAALSLAFLPNVIWEFQRASSHSIALLAAVTWTLWAWFRLMNRQGRVDWLMLGLIIGLGGLSKANYWAVPVGLAVDGAASNEAADMASEAHACWMIHRADPRAGQANFANSHADPHAEARATQPGGLASAMTVEDVVHIGTAGGARLLGLDGVGTLEVGQAADLAVYGLDQPRYFGLHDPAIGPVASGGRPTLRALLVQGRVVVENDTIPGLDLAQLRHDAQAFVEQVIARVNSADVVRPGAVAQPDTPARRV